MKTKFSAVVKIRKKVVDDIQNAIFAVDAMIVNTKSALSDATTKLIGLDAPSSGSFANLVVFEEMKRSFRFEIEEISNTLAAQEQQKSELIANFIEANAELEKIKYLENEEIKKVLKARAVKEAKELDEVSVMLYNNRRES